MERVEKIKSIIDNWRQQFKTNSKSKIITSRRANRKFLNMLKGRRNVHRWRQRKRRTYTHYPIIPTAPYISDGWYPAEQIVAPSAPPMHILLDPEMPH